MRESLNAGNAAALEKINKSRGYREDEVLFYY